MSSRSSHLITFFALAIFGVLVLGFTASPANAGTNGQQISFETYAGTPSRIVITGPNQHGAIVTFDTNVHGWSKLSRHYEGGGFWSYQLNNWWWKGKATIKTYLGSKSTSRTCNVPAFYIFNTYDCGIIRLPGF